MVRNTANSPGSTGPTISSPEIDNQFDLGSISNRWKKLYISDSVIPGVFSDTSDETKKVEIDSSGSATGTKATIIVDVDQSKTITIPDVAASNVTLVSTSGVQTLSNKTLTLPSISTISNTGVLTLPTSTDTLIGRSTLDTLYNKTLENPNLNSVNSLTFSNILPQTQLGYYHVSFFTPTVSFGGASVGITYASNVGTFVGIGNLVYVDMYVQLSNKGSSTGNVSVSLPIVSSNTSQSVSSNFIASAITLPGTTTMMTAQFAKNSASFGIFGWRAGGSEITILTNANFANNSSFNFSGVYWA